MDRRDRSRSRSADSDASWIYFDFIFRRPCRVFAKVVAVVVCTYQYIYGTR